MRTFLGPGGRPVPQLSPREMKVKLMPQGKPAILVVPLARPAVGDRGDRSNGGHNRGPELESCGLRPYQHKMLAS